MSTESATVNLTNHFLIAMPAMADPNFSRTLTYICEHNTDGALGIVVNRPMEMSVALLFEQVNIALDHTELGKQPVYFGGPVQNDRGFVLHRPRGEWQSSLLINDELALTSSRDILTAIGSSGEPHDFILTLGYAGWAAGQLEWELSQNAWLTVPASSQIMFGLPPEERMPAALQLLGVDFANLSDVAGHA